MKYNEFFASFYIGRTTGGLVGYKSKEKIPEFLLEAALGRGNPILPTSSNTYAKWLDGKRTPDSAIWETLVRDFQEDNFIDQVTKALNSNELFLVAHRFGISVPSGETIAKDALAFAIAKQLYAIAQGNGEADLIAPSRYRPALITFPEYISKAQTKYSKTETPFTENEERELDEVYVCNTITNRQNTGISRSRNAVKIFDNATLKDLRAYSNKLILIANGGMGKSMMLQHLLMESLKEHETTGVLPIFAELREFSYERKELMDYIIRAVSRFDDSFTEDEAKKLLDNGKCQLLFDGIDEIDPSDANNFERQLSDLIDKYPNNLYVMASRECEMLQSAAGFARLYLQPFNAGQSKRLISNLLDRPEDEELRDEIIQYMDDAFLKKHSVFACNPMLLTFIVMNYPIIESFYGKQSLFYKEIYRTIVTGHDQAKKAYDRIFHSAQNAEEFTKVFREFCTITYIDKVHEFDTISFEDYFNRLKTKETIENPHAMTKDTFLRDACATACMMYEESLKVLYIDQGFQEFLFAEHLLQAELDEVVELGRSLWDQPEAVYGGSNAFDMFYEMAQDKVEKCFFLPYLNELIYGKDDDEAFLQFMKYGYQTIEYNVIDLDLVAKWQAETGLEWILLKPHIMESANVIYSLIMRTQGLDSMMCFEVWQNALNYEQHRAATFAGEKFYDADSQTDRLTGRRIIGELADFENANNIESFLKDGDHLLPLGYEYKIDLSEVVEHPENYPELIDVLKTKNEDLWKAFATIKDYYSTLKTKFKE